MFKMTTRMAVLSLMFASSMAVAQGYEQQEAYSAEEADMTAPMDEMSYGYDDGFETEAVNPEARRPGPGRPGHPGRPDRPRDRWITMNCGTNSPFGYNECSAGGRILEARLISQRSFLPCKAGQSWGAKNNRIWVRFGCNGKFRVQVRDNNRWP